MTDRTTSSAGTEHDTDDRPAGASDATEDRDPTPAFEIDLEPEDQGTAAVADEQTA